MAMFPVVLVTGFADEDSMQTALDVAATTLIAKPVQWELLGHQVRYLLRRWRANSAMQKHRSRKRVY